MIPDSEIREPESSENAQKRHSETTSAAFYAYVELLESGKGNRPVKVVKKLKRCAWRYKVAPGDEAETQRRAARAEAKALEAAVEIAGEALYRLRNEKTPFTRVFISTLGDMPAGRQDRTSLNYFLLT
jgi:hypothetical protein